MKIIVEKYGGTSLGSIDRIKAVARRVAASQEKGHGVVVVTSAIGNTTDELFTMAKEIGADPRQRELGMLLSTGEVISSSLIAMALQALGKKASALTGTQSGIITRGAYDNAKIATVDTSRIKDLLEKGEIVVVAGYQGKMANEITVLGRGGSDISAVALAAALKAEACYIYSDVAGIYTCDPNLVPNASSLACISYDEMIELASSGAQIMMGRAVELARKYDLNIVVGSGFENSPGTLITKREKKVEELTITGIASQKEVAMIDIFSYNEGSKISVRVLNSIAEKEINIRLLTSSKIENWKSHLSIIVNIADANDVINILQNLCLQSWIKKYHVNTDVAQVSIVGYGIAQNYGIASEVFDVLSENNVEILLTSTSEIKISVIVSKKQADKAVAKLHENFGLDTLNDSANHQSVAVNNTF